MASKRKLTMRAKKLARKQSQTKPGGASKYALKRRRALAGWDNPRSPFRVSEARSVVVTAGDGQADEIHAPDERLAADALGTP